MSIVSGAAKQGSTRGFYPRVINGSLRFNDDDSAYLSWTPDSAGNRKTWTLSFWIKRTNLTDKSILDTTTGTSDSANILFQPDDTLRFQSYLSSSQQFRLTTTQVFRDVSAWYHFVFVLDTTNATSSERARIYVNGERVSNFSTENYPTQNLDCQFNIADIHLLGVRGYAATQFLDAYLADVYFIDGQALSASDFGETKNGVWVAKDYEGTFGTNGFHLTFEDDTEVEAFNTVLYRGTGTDNTSITGMGFQPDLLWIKTRNTGTYHNLFDAVRTDVNGMPARLYPNETLAEEPSIYSTETGNVKDFESDGFLLGNGGNTNTSGNSYVAWGWKAGDSNVSNTDGSITSTVRANDTYGFSIVSYTGNATAGATVGHGLSSKPDFIIAKNRNTTSPARDWLILHKAYEGTSAENMRFTTGAVASAGSQDSSGWYRTAPTSSVFYLGNGDAGDYAGDTNITGGNMIAYCWAEKTGYSKFGSYTGNGSSTGPTVTCGFKPAFVLIKNTDRSTNCNWVMFDNTRETDDIADQPIYANLSNAEQSPSSTIKVDFQDNGFQIRGYHESINFSGETMIYAAFADTREAAFWLDQSGNDNDWQPVNLDHNDTVADSPTNNFCTLNPLYGNSNLTYSDGNLVARQTSNDWNWSTGTSTMMTSSGKYYAEFEVVGSYAEWIVGILSDETSSYYIYTSNQHFGRSGNSGNGYVIQASQNNFVFYASANEGSATTINGGNQPQAGDIIGLAVDLDGGSIIITLNGNTITNGTQSISTGGKQWGFGFSLGDNPNVSGSPSIAANFGQQPFKYDPPA